MALVLVHAGTVTPVASASACERWGDVRPEQLRAREARKATLCLVNREGRRPVSRRLGAIGSFSAPPSGTAA